jgi:hypothetical protein
MESIDITDSTFTLNIPENMDIDMDIGSKLNMDTLHNSFSNTFLDNYMMIIFIGLFCIGMIVYKYYYRRNTNTENNYMDANENMDCPGGFCNMRKNDTTLQEQ